MASEIEVRCSLLDRGQALATFRQLAASASAATHGR